MPRIAKNRLSPCELKLKHYQGKSIPILGSYKLREEFKELTKQLSLVIVEEALPSLLGLNWFELLGLGISGINHIISPELDMLSREFGSVFKEVLDQYVSNFIYFGSPSGPHTS